MARANLTREIAQIPDGALVLVDGLIASSVPGVLVPQAGRLRVVVLVHMPLGSGPTPADLADARDLEQEVLTAAQTEAEKKDHPETTPEHLCAHAADVVGEVHHRAPEGGHLALDARARDR